MSQETGIFMIVASILLSMIEYPNILNFTHKGNLPAEKFPREPGYVSQRSKQLVIWRILQ